MDSRLRGNEGLKVNGIQLRQLRHKPAGALPCPAFPPPPAAP